MKKLMMNAVKSMAILACFSPSAFAADQYRSAMFDFSGKQLAEKVAAATGVNASASTVILYCQSAISVQGQASHTKCFDKAGQNALAGATEQAIQSLPFSVAEVNGKQVPVRMSYRVAFHGAEKLSALLIPNIGSMYERYGRDYIAPQERLDVANWYEEYSKNSWVGGEAFLGEGEMSRVSATVDVEGKTDIVRTLDPHYAYKRDANIVKNAVKKSKFIPGFVNGKPVPMGYLAVVNYQDGNSAVSSR